MGDPTAEAVAQPADDGLKLLNIADAGAYLGVSRTTLARLLDRGLIPYTRPSPRKYQIRTADLDAYKRSVTHGRPPADG